MDWRQVFVERYKLRRAWMGGQCHVRTFEGHSGGISCVQFDGGRIVSGSHDKTIKVWNVKTNSPWSVITLAGHSGEVRCLHLGTFNTEKLSCDLYLLGKPSIKKTIFLLTFVNKRGMERASSIKKNHS